MAVTEVERFQLFIGGKLLDAACPARRSSRRTRTGARRGPCSPTAGPLTSTTPSPRRGRRSRAVGASSRALPGPRSCDRSATRSPANGERLALLEVRDSGKLLREIRGQLMALPQWYYYFAGLADKLEGRTVPPVNPNYFCYTRREPVGVVGAITPWNSPLLLLTFKLAPLLAAGNTCVAKPSEHSPASTVAFAQVLHEAGLPAGVFNVITSSARACGEALAGHPGVDKIAFTGSGARPARRWRRPPAQT